MLPKEGEIWHVFRSRTRIGRNWPSWTLIVALGPAFLRVVRGSTNRMYKQLFMMVESKTRIPLEQMVIEFKPLASDHPAAESIEQAPERTGRHAPPGMPTTPLCS